MIGSLSQVRCHDLIRFLRGLYHEQMMVNLLGGRQSEVPEMYDLASPINHVGPDSPPTLLFQGEHDSLVPVEAARALHRKLADAGVPTVYVEFPSTEHAFDLVLPRLSPPAQAALYDLDRFLALMALSRAGTGTGGRRAVPMSRS